MTSPKPTGPLVGLTVLDLSRILAGPYLTMCLGDMGARVIKIEQPGSGDDTRSWGPPFLGQDSAYFLALNRNKESVTVNLKDPRGQSLIRKLAQQADIVVENFRPGVIERLGLPYEVLQAGNRGLIMVHISAFGDEGPDREKPGYDLLAQAMGGAMSLTGEPGGPPIKTGYAVGDLGAAMFGLSGVLAALYQRSVTGQGQYLTTSLFETQLAFHVHWAMNYFLTGDTPQPQGTAHSNLAPYQAFRAADGYFVLAAGNDALWQRLCEILPAPELGDDPQFLHNADRVRHQPALEKALSARFCEQPCAYWIDRLTAAGIPVGPVQDIAAIYHSRQVGALNMVQTIAHPEQSDLPQVGLPIHFSGATGNWLREPPPLLGQHTERILREQGCSPAVIAEWARDGVV